MGVRVSSDADYQTRKREAEDRWREIARLRQVEREGREAEYASMPDVSNPPRPDVPTLYDGVVCDKGHTGWYVRRWVVCNGTRYRMEVQCSECDFHGTYCFMSKDWIWRLR